jgi:hypothetical protein
MCVLGWASLLPGDPCATLHDIKVLHV